MRDKADQINCENKYEIKDQQNKDNEGSIILYLDN